VIKRARTAADELGGMAVTCRICGELWADDEYVDVGAGRGCARCGGDPLCDGCGHQRSEHAGVFGGGATGCREKNYDFETLTAEPCACAGYVAGAGSFGDAAFA
jgi:hypothetical protein